MNAVFLLHEYDGNLVALLSGSGLPDAFIAGWDGNQWTQFGGNWECWLGSGGIITHNGQLHVLGRRAGSNTVEIARWNGSVWVPVTNLNHTCTAYANNLISYGGLLLVPDQGYSQSGNYYWSSLRAYDGTTWSTVESWSHTHSSSVDELAVIDSELFVAVSPGEVCAWNGTSWTDYGYTYLWEARGGLVKVGDTLFAGGMNNIYDPFIVKWTGTDWELVRYDPTSFRDIGTMISFEDELVIGRGRSVSRWYVERYDGANWTQLGGEMNSWVLALAEYNGKLIAGGVFTTIDGDSVLHIAEYTETTTPVAIADFRATHQSGGVELAWDVAADEAFDGFNLYRRIDGRGDVLVNASMIAANARSYRDDAVTPGLRYSYQLVAVGAVSGEVRSQRVTVEVPAVSTVLHQNIPNPFNPETTIRFAVSGEEHVTITIYDATGRRVLTLVDATYSPGEWSVPWDGTAARGSQVASGVYYYRMRAGNADLSRKMVLLK